MRDEGWGEVRMGGGSPILEVGERLVKALAKDLGLFWARDT